MGLPPHSVSTLMLSSARARRRISCVTWSASSRVGHSTSACTAKAARVQVASSGSANAAVLPLPVLGLGDEVVAGQRQRQAGGLDRRHRTVLRCALPERLHPV
jgi:hypothetical protein